MYVVQHAHHHIMALPLILFHIRTARDSLGLVKSGLILKDELVEVPYDQQRNKENSGSQRRLIFDKPTCQWKTDHVEDVLPKIQWKFQEPRILGPPPIRVWELYGKLLGRGSQPKKHLWQFNLTTRPTQLVIIQEAEQTKWWNNSLTQTSFRKWS